MRIFSSFLVPYISYFNRKRSFTESICENHMVITFLQVKQNFEGKSFHLPLLWDPHSSKFGDNWKEITTLIMFKKIGGKYFLYYGNHI